MKTSSLRACALLAGSLFVVACSHMTGFLPSQYTPNAGSPASRGAGPVSYRVLHSFGADGDGISPNAGLLDRGDTLYGTTYGGGTQHHCGSDGGCGTVFSLTTGGVESVLHSFGGTKPGGREPGAPLIDVNGTLYGTTEYGGTFDYGTVFRITPDGKERVLHTFGKGTDGSYPSSALLDVGGTLYGTTGGGGTNDGEGTVFSITASGKEEVLYNFGRTPTDAQAPDAGLIDVHGTLYGTTYNGGAKTCGSNLGCGTVFSITTSGKERVLHSFHGPDGGKLLFGLVDVKGTLYGTAPYGGTHYGGVLFSITTGGTERVLHNFGKGTDGNFPYGNLIEVGGTLYGATWAGGAYGFGTLFSMMTDGREKVLHNFDGVTDGRHPLGSLVYKDGSLFGATNDGGTHRSGTVFELHLTQ